MLGFASAYVFFRPLLILTHRGGKRFADLNFFKKESTDKLDAFNQSFNFAQSASENFLLHAGQIMSSGSVPSSKQTVSPQCGHSIS